ncbi:MULTISPECIES: GIY-YIG nuclease family protein [Roseivirga]|uniref:GIY-YIG nuclease family protein n=1 Tax=Roseivirga TaxID=290180 RepID=UPI0029348545|nr:GIY-YIG nuclease family protein [Roseivirga spongicola]WPZ11806.1 GIY-YIG nuclease family protein [Roseivirga spongicola]
MVTVILRYEGSYQLAHSYYLENNKSTLMAGLHVYILTNTSKKVLYVGVTNDLEKRLIQHYQNRGEKRTFAGRYYCYYLIYFEYHHNNIGGIEREKEIKGWSRQKKVDLINSYNPKWLFLNDQITKWPPDPGTF